MSLFPPGTPVTVRLDGSPLPAYVRAYVWRGRTYAPVRPLVARVADRLWFEGDVLVIVRDGRIVRVPMARRAPDALDSAFVAVAPVLRALGASVAYDAHQRAVEVRTAPAGGIATPSPYQPGAGAVSPRTVFTPQPVETPRPVWSGSPLPRRTPLPAGSPPG